VLKAGSRRFELALDRDWRPLSFSPSTHGRLESRMAFAGYGITAEHPAYDDYAAQDVRGRVVLVFRLEPGADDPASPFAGTAITEHGDLRRKVQNAFDHGASAVLITSPSTASGDQLIGFDAEAGAGEVPIPVAQVRAEAIAPALAALGVDLASARQQIDSSFQPASLPLELTTELTVDVDPITVEAANVIGILPGSDPELRSEAIVVGAHYDHLGRGGQGSLAGVPTDSTAADSAAADAIHNGADDNASGVSALIEVAAAVRTDPEPPARTIIFVAFTGEEEGLLGSARYVAAPAIPLARTRAMINMDTIGRGPGRQVFVSGASSSAELKRVVSEESADDFIELTFDDEVLGASDQASFYSHQVPVLFFFTPAHADYHRPTDDWEKIDVHYLERVARLVDRVTCRLAARDATIHFQPGAPQMAAADPHGGGEGYGSRAYGPYLGTVPDFAGSGAGVRLAAVRAGSPAALAGLQGGDVIVQWEGQVIKSLGDYAAALRRQRPGDSVALTFLRDGSPVHAVAVLGERP
jgi:hypothetical protein